MNRASAAAGALAVLALAGCAAPFGPRPERSGGIESEVRKADREARESRTLSNLAALELRLSDYVNAEGRVPERLEPLVPKYLAEIPAADTGVGGHRETDAVQYYPPDAIKDGVVDGGRLLDTGRWGYVQNGRQVIIFVDCTHKTSRGKPWYRERGVF